MKKLLPVLLCIAALSLKAQNDHLYFYDDLSIPPASDSNEVQMPKWLKILREFRVQLYLQPEWQRADTSGKTSTGPLGIDGVGSFQGGTFPAAANNRFLLRRARFRVSFEHKNARDLKILEMAFQMEAYDYIRGTLAIKEFYGRIIDPWIGWFSFQGGIFNRPWGYETPASQAFSESPEIARVNQTMLPTESDLGAELIIESPAKFEALYLRLDAGVLNGQGIGAGFQTGTWQRHKDFIGRIKVGKVWSVRNAKLGFNASASYYNGAILQTTNYVYQLNTDSTGAYYYKNIADPSQQLKKIFKREYYGAHLELKADYPIGTTTLRGEFMAGIQPGGATSSLVPLGQYNAPPVSDLFLRKFNGAVLTFNQAFKIKYKNHLIMQDVTVKYDWYDPQAKVKGDQLLPARGFSITDIRYSTLGLGYTLTPANWFKLMVWYDLVTNEKTIIPGWSADFKKDNVLTIRTQFYFDTWWFNQKSKRTDNLMLKKY